MVHHEFRKGQKILIIKRDGTSIVDKYVGEKSNYLLCENISLKWKDIRCTSIYINKGGNL